VNARRETDQAVAMLASCLGQHAALVWPVRDALYCERRVRTYGRATLILAILFVAFVVGTLLEAAFLTYGGCE
jgi:hypothetical protein